MLVEDLEPSVEAPRSVAPRSEHLVGESRADLLRLVHLVVQRQALSVVRVVV
jgi:hypothetical protein